MKQLLLLLAVIATLSLLADLTTCQLFGLFGLPTSFGRPSPLVPLLSSSTFYRSPYQRPPKAAKPRPPSPANQCRYTGACSRIDHGTTLVPRLFDTTTILPTRPLIALAASSPSPTSSTTSSTSSTGSTSSTTSTTTTTTTTTLAPIVTPRRPAALAAASAAVG